MRINIIYTTHRGSLLPALTILNIFKGSSSYLAPIITALYGSENLTKPDIKGVFLNRADFTILYMMQEHEDRKKKSILKGVEFSVSIKKGAVPQFKDFSEVITYMSTIRKSSLPGLTKSFFLSVHAGVQEFLESIKKGICNKIKIFSLSQRAYRRLFRSHYTRILNFPLSVRACISRIFLHYKKGNNRLKRIFRVTHASLNLIIQVFSNLNFPRQPREGKWNNFRSQSCEQIMKSFRMQSDAGS